MLNVHGETDLENTVLVPVADVDTLTADSIEQFVPPAPYFFSLS